MGSKIRIVILFVLVLFGAWFYFTPHLTVKGMRAAVEAKDAERLSRYVDFSALKGNLKASFNEKIDSELMKDQGGNQFASLGAALVTAFINPMIDSLVTPEGLAMMMKGEKPNSLTNAEGAKTSDSEVDMSMAYESFDRFIVLVKAKASTDEPVGLVFSRDGLFSWKLSAMRLPM
ncbi:MAG TPA: DUF2939 domain-containing protein [Hydrogenophaga sp.]|uniref:DUF2939 domain-containing protein n=1 Tax=Hydrogenophaga sp. TaxID=1904254 RepID=UPI002C35123F|nr:DUF2939 domain-containing protein [Hydrogenophaga sp.]HMN94742.1 DUF2939 domain-containing protein [Hydrogenophaga sp.]HMP09727.1 DUF2939 domain-containing protein [Hydrogenophaga sp.]